MLNKYLLIILFFTKTTFAVVVPSMPDLPMFGDFNPNQLRVQFNEFIGIKPNFLREKRIASQIEEAVMDGEVEYLKLKNKREIFSIYMESEIEPTKGGIIILHNRGHHPNWIDTIKPLRIGLAEQGWNTLSVQMPVLEKAAKYYDYVPIFPYSHMRIEAAIEFYKKQGIENIILIAHGCGAHMAMSYIDKYGDKNISAYIGIGMGATDYKQKIIKEFPLDKMNVPILDIYAEQDFAGVKRTAPYRNKLIKFANNTKSRQLIIKEANHYYQKETSYKKLIKEINSWLGTLLN